MLEWMDRYRDTPRVATHLTIDRPMLIFLGLTLGDFVAGVVTFLAVILLWDAGAAVPTAIGGGVLVSWGAREARRRFPSRYLQHVSWSLGTQRVPGVPDFFRKRRLVVFGP